MENYCSETTNLFNTLQVKKDNHEVNRPWLIGGGDTDFGQILLGSLLGVSGVWELGSNTSLQNLTKTEWTLHH